MDNPFAAQRVPYPSSLVHTDCLVEIAPQTGKRKDIPMGKLYLLLALSLLPAAAASGQMKMAMDTGDPVPPDQLPRPQHIDGVGNVRFPISANPEAQKWFEQGYNLLYDFWDYEADRAFEESIRADPTCAMCYWGLYQSETFNHSETKTYAQGSLAKAMELRKHATGREKLYIEAADAHEAAIRAAGSDDNAKFDREIEILRTLVKKNPSDTNARIALSEAVSDGFDDKGEPRKGQKESLDLLAGVLKDEPDNSAANHLWIHAVEASAHPEQALHSAQILGSLAPASGHMVHMPGHIFYRTGDYGTAQASFDASALADETYMRTQQVAVDNDWNYVHNLMYSVANLLEAGRLEEAAQVSAKLGKARGHLENTLYPWSPRDAIARLNPDLPIALRTGDWQKVTELVKAANVAQNMPNMTFLANGLTQVALGMQAVEAHDAEAADRHSAMLDASLWRMSQQIKEQEAKDKEAKKNNSAASSGNQAMSPDPLAQPLMNMLSIMSLELRASNLANQNKVSEAETLFAQARKQEKDLGYREPPFYIRPVAEAEGEAMMTAGNWQAAKTAFAAALVERPNSGFALYGAARATEKLGDGTATTAAYRQFMDAWKIADATLPEKQHAQEWLSQHAAAANRN
jgi:tetratricopeptide (TPR) repeat protein